MVVLAGAPGRRLDERKIMTATASNPWAGKTITERTNEITAALRATDARSQAHEAYLGLTQSGREFMALVGAGHFDFFDDGITEHSGNWGEGLAQQAAPAMGKAWRSMGGIMSATKKAGLWLTHEDEHDGTWWALTALGAEVALLAAGKAPGTQYVNEGEGGSW